MIAALRSCLMLIASLAWALCCLSSVQAVPPDSTDEALRKMCERGLSVSAADYCGAQVGLYMEQAPQRSRWAMRQMECQCQAALQAGADSQAAWAAVAKTESEYRREFTDDPRLPWLAWQLARSDLLCAQQALARWLATPAADKQRELALQAIRRVQSQLDELESDIKKRLPLAEPRAQAVRTQASSSELQELSIDGTLLRCESLLVRARCYPLGSPDRLAALADVDRTASEMLLRAPADWSSRDELIVARATAGLEVGKRAASLQTLIELFNGQPVESALHPNEATPTPTASPRARLRAGSAAVEALCVDKQLDEAQENLDQLIKNFTGPEVELSQMRVSLARLESLPTSQRPAELKTVVDQAQDLGKRYGAYWRNRGEALLVASAAGDATSGHNNSSLPDQLLMQDLVSVEVRQLLAGGQTTAAVTKLNTAAAAALSAGRVEQSIGYSLEAAKVLQREKDWLAAADLLAPVAAAHPEAPNAAAAHVLAAWCLAQALQSTPADKALAQHYELALVEQLKLWPTANESYKAEEYLVQWYQRNKRYEDLASMWADRAECAAQPELKLTALRQWLEVLLGRLSRAQITPQLTRLVSSIREGVKFSDCERSAVIVAFAAQMLSAPLTQTEAETISGLKVPSHLLEQTKNDQALLSAIIALASARRSDVTATHNALQLLDSDQLSTVVMLAWCKSMVQALDEIPPGQVTSWSAVAQLIPWSEGNTSKLTPSLKMVGLRLSQLRTPQPTQASAHLKEIRQLAASHPNDPHMQLDLAVALAHSVGQNETEQAENFRKALAILKSVATRTSKESEAYLRSRWLELRWQSGKGETAAAAQIAKLTLGSHHIQPDWWKARFEAVAKQN